MNDNASIFMNENDSYKGINLHENGYLTCAGETLLEHYRDDKKVSDLIALGTILILGAVVGEKVNFDDFFNSLKTDQCLAYYRDGEVEKFEQYSCKDINKSLDKLPGIIYLYEDGEWSVNVKRKPDAWEPLVDAIAADRDKKYPKGDNNDVLLRYWWQCFSDVPIDKDENIEIDWFGFRKGTNKYDIWHWFDERFSKGLGWFMEHYNSETGLIEV